jgi:hypothetical protein
MEGSLSGDVGAVGIRRNYVEANIEKIVEKVKSANESTALGAYPLERRSGEGSLRSGTRRKNGTSLRTPSKLKCDSQKIVPQSPTKTLASTGFRNHGLRGIFNFDDDSLGIFGHRKRSLHGLLLLIISKVLIPDDHSS